jgi:hypothetical protein
MRITYACPSCHGTTTLDHVESADTLECPRCRAAVPIPAGSIGGEPGSRRLLRCLVCPSVELFVRKDFPQRVGLAIVVVGLAASCVAWANRELVATFAILFGSALLDVLLFFLTPDCLSCYRCGSRYRGDGITAHFGGFDLETHEKHRQFVARSGRAAAGRGGNAAEPHVS